MKLSAIAVGCAVVWAVGCATVPPPPPAPPPPPPPPSSTMHLGEAAVYLARDVASQLSAATGGRIVIDPLVDKASGQQTEATLQVQEALWIALAEALPNHSVQVLNATAADQTGLVATGTLAQTSERERYLLVVALTDRASGVVIAQAAARFSQPGLSHVPTSFYRDSPSLVRDRSVDAYIRTAETPAGSLADPLYVEQLPMGALIAAAIEEYNAGNWELALAGYTAAALRDDGQNLRTFNGLYLANMRLDRAGDAEAAFGLIATLGLATGNLEVKVLFRAGTTEFIPDPSFGGVYPMWIRQIAGATAALGQCLHVIGHTSASGSDAVNDPLSLARAEAVRRLLEEADPNLGSRVRASGRGSREMVFGTGADDASDAVDRRVEFEVEACG